MDVDIRQIAERYGTPLYLYDLDSVVARLQHMREHLDRRVQIYYAVKANSNIKILEYVKEYVDGLDVSSGGEIKQSISAGYRGSQMSYAGPGKTEPEIELALAENCGSISVENLDDLARIVEVSRRIGHKANISVRINPLQEVKSFALKMGGRPTQFGIDEEDLGPITEQIHQNSACLSFVGYHVYSGTQSLDAADLADHYRYIFEMIDRIARESRLSPNVLNFGGGFGIPYHEAERDIEADRVLEEINTLVHSFGQRYRQTVFRIELGRYIIGEFGYYLTSVLATKESRGRRFVIVDGGMHQNLSVSGKLGQVIMKNYRVENLSNSSGEIEKVDIVGALCTPVDRLAAGCMLPRARTGDLLVFGNSGAYGYTASPLFFLGHETPLEVISRDGKTEIIREAKEVVEWN